VEMFFDRVVMGLPPTQVDEKRYQGRHKIVISTGAKRSGEICGSADPSRNCFSTERSGVESTHPVVWSSSLGSHADFGCGLDVVRET
jgi:hypothetical protein